MTKGDDNVLKWRGRTLEFSVHIGAPQGSVFGLVRFSVIGLVLVSDCLRVEGFQITASFLRLAQQLKIFVSCPPHVEVRKLIKNIIYSDLLVQQRVSPGRMAQ